MYLLMLLLPLLSSVILSLSGRYMGSEGAAFMSVFLLMCSWMCALFIFMEVCLFSNMTSMKIYQWLLLDMYSMNMGLLFDNLSSTMIVVVTTISMLVHLYSTAYMSHDPYLVRFMSYLSLFTFCMLILVTADNFLQLFVGWEGVGLCSYLLINFWFTSLLANKAALKAMMMNRIADVFFTISILLILLMFKTTNFVIVFNLIPFMADSSYNFLGFVFPKISLIAFFLFVGAMGKSAQMGLHTWLPDAMEGPTPVSSLLHAATMVTAGVFLMMRCSIMFEYSELVLALLMFFGGVTALFAGIVAIFQYDLKKIIAYSTCSQLGYMFFSCGLSNYYVAFFHLWNHAFFKALLFLSAGAVIHAFFDEQDMRSLGRFSEFLPFTYICFWMGSLAIMGFPFLTGFYSKDLILEFAYSRFMMDSNFMYFLGLTAAICTAIYSMRLLYYVFFYKKFGNGPRVLYHLMCSFEMEASWQMFISMFILAILSVSMGYVSSELLLGMGQLYWQDSMFVLPSHYSPMDTEFVHPFMKNLPVLLSLSAMYLTLFCLFMLNMYVDVVLMGMNDIMIITILFFV